MVVKPLLSTVKIQQTIFIAELTCCADSGVKKDWMTGEAQFGKLVGGTTVECSHSLARNLLEDESVVLMSLAQHVKFEVAVPTIQYFQYVKQNVLFFVVPTLYQ